MNQIEEYILKLLIDWFGESGGIIAEHMIILIFSMMFGYLLCILVRATKYRVNPDLRIRFSNEMKEILMMKIEQKPISEIVILNPKTFQEKIEVYIALTMLRDIQKTEVTERRVKRAYIIFISLLIMVSIALVMIILFIFNTAGNHTY